MSSVRLLVGTRKGAFVLTSDGGKGWGQSCLSTLIRISLKPRSLLPKRIVCKPGEDSSGPRVHLAERQSVDVLKMSVARAEREIMLDRERRDPEVIRRDRCPLLSQFSEDARVGLGRRQIRKQYLHAGALEKAIEHGRVLQPLIARGKPSAQLS